MVQSENNDCFFPCRCIQPVVTVSFRWSSVFESAIYAGKCHKMILAAAVCRGVAPSLRAALTLATKGGGVKKSHTDLEFPRTG